MRTVAPTRKKERKRCLFFSVKDAEERKVWLFLLFVTLRNLQFERRFSFVSRDLFFSPGFLLPVELPDGLLLGGCDPSRPLLAFFFSPLFLCLSCLLASCRTRTPLSLTHTHFFLLAFFHPSSRFSSRAFFLRNFSLLFSPPSLSVLSFPKMDVEVTEEAQSRICRFSSLNHKFVDLESRIEKLTDALRTLRDAQEEAMIVVDPSDIMLKIGECFASADSDTIEEELDRQIAAKEAVLAECRDELEATKKEMTELKTKLYGEFGDRINLDKGVRLGPPQREEGKKETGLRPNTRACQQERESDIGRKERQKRECDKIERETSP
ncbi:prefoldin subunit protein [Toxoplasma gondii TgCatPRC2]|uniref:Prefoldin subunit protein n=2 Tax=Toxoplasma gondii TaxID=5811 RepID=A0A151HJF8_TOXGO|nr:prefoldin subunit protein [Toxoplasma gondii ME49]EPT27922.1 prefoldin subunit protein [Toxoplasma gondii ME49]KYK69513.1 prefoldin subunit protein [Toxoplasma gondii TgCatPRC2]|eukprot:XP_018636391.1 prefoldin subunit protein [Toxoplasma gondii ME49]